MNFFYGVPPPLNCISGGLSWALSGTPDHRRADPIPASSICESSDGRCDVIFALPFLVVEAAPKPQLQSLRRRHACRFEESSRRHTICERRRSRPAPSVSTCLDTTPRTPSRGQGFVGRVWETPAANSRRSRRWVEIGAMRDRRSMENLSPVPEGSTVPRPRGYR